MSQRKPSFLAPALCLFVALSVLTACGKSPPVHFYSLGTGVAAAEAPVQSAQPCPSLGVGPVELPAYLDRSQIVTRGEGNRMNMAETEQWIEPVQANFTSALMDALSGLVCAGPLTVFPGPGGGRPDRQLAVQVRQFDGKLGGEAVLRAEWSVTDKDGRVLAWKNATLREPCPGVDYGSLVAAQSRLVVKLAQEMAGTLTTLGR